MAGCAQPEERILTLSDGQGISITPNTNARLARYDGMQMRARAFSKKNGPRRIRATAALEFERTATGLRLTKRTDALGKVYVGEGVELVGRNAHAQQHPPCEVGVPMEEQTQFPCTPPPCEEVDEVEPCTPPEEPYDPYTEIVTDTEVLGSAASAVAAIANFTPVTLDSIPTDSVGMFVQDTNGVVIAHVFNRRGLLLGAILAGGFDIESSVWLTYENDELISMTSQFVSSDGDTLLLELTPELAEWNLRQDLADIHLSAMWAQVEGDSCSTKGWKAVREAGVALLATVNAGAAIYLAVNPATQAVRTAVSATSIIIDAGITYVPTQSSGIFVPEALAASGAKKKAWSALAGPWVLAGTAVGTAIANIGNAWDAWNEYQECKQGEAALLIFGLTFPREIWLGEALADSPLFERW